MRKVNWTYWITAVVVHMFLVGAAAISFSHIVDVSTTMGLTWEAWTVPFFIDGIAVLGKVGRSKKFAVSTQKAGLWLMAIGGALSLAANVAAGENDGQKAYGVLVVAGFVLTEWYAGKLEKAPAPVVVEVKKLDPQVAAERAAKARRTREANKLKKLTPAQKAARTRALNADRPVSPAWAIEGRQPTADELASINS